MSAAVPWQAADVPHIVIYKREYFSRLALLSLFDDYLSFIDMQRYGILLKAPNKIDKNLSKNDKLTYVSRLVCL